MVIAATFTFASPVIPTTSTTGSDKVRAAAFQTDAARPFWRGYLKAYQRNSSGMVPVDANGVPLVSSLVWEAGSLLAARAASTRTIYTSVGGTRQNFIKTNSAITNGMLNAADSTEHDKIVDFIRGIDTYDEDLDAKSLPGESLQTGRHISCQSGTCTPPFLPSTDATFAAFAVANASRLTVVPSGANDGMLHAFRESDGYELVFRRSDFLDTLKKLAVRSASHEFYGFGRSSPM